MAHKFCSYQIWILAEYKLWAEGLILAVIVAVAIGFVFAAPGAVYIHGNYISREQMGKISFSRSSNQYYPGRVFLFNLCNIQHLHNIMLLGLLGFTVNSFLALF